MIGPSLRLRLLCQRVALRRSLQTAAFSQPKPLLALQLTSLNQTLNKLNIRMINTTKKNKDHHTIDVYDPEYVNTKKPKGPETAKDFADVSSQKHWISHGFDFVDPANDRHMFHVAMFVMVTCGFVCFSWGLYYFPDFVLHDWALREGFLELDRRERLGLPLIDPNLVDPAKLDLPTDEELGDYQVYT